MRGALQLTTSYTTARGLTVKERWVAYGRLLVFGCPARPVPASQDGMDELHYVAHQLLKVVDLL